MILTTPTSAGLRRLVAGLLVALLMLANAHSIYAVGPSDTIATVAGDGTSGYSGDGGPASAAQLNFPIGVALDAAGNLFIADTNNHRVRRVAPAVDTAAPTIAIATPAEGTAYTLGQVVDASYACADEASGSGLATCVGTAPNGSPIDTASVGAKTFTVNAADTAGNTNTLTHNYSVGYAFSGFLAPVDNNGVLNIAKAGQTIALKWRITDANGNPVTNLTSVSVTAASLACSTGTTTDQIEEYATGASGLQNLGSGYYQWNWKSPTSYANSCKTLKLDLDEGAGFEHVALFQFKK
jgi:hypothetical protein